MSTIDDINNYPDISFIDDLTLDQLMGEMVNDFTTKYEELTGESISLGKADPNRLILQAAALQIYQGFVNIDKAGKMNFLKYATGDYLENLCALKGITRSEGSYAVTTLRFTLSAAQTSVITIPAGTRATDGNENYFYTTEVAEVPAGELYVDVSAQSVSVGEEANDIEIGEIGTLVDYVAYVASVSNITKTQGGTGEEDDNSLKERFYLAPASYSVAGSEAAYEYWTKTCNASISDVKVVSPDPCVVQVYILVDGELPEDTILEEVEDFLADENIRPLTDQVSVHEPEVVEFNIGLTYYVASSNTSNVVTIQTAVAQEIENYITWQTGKIGRDINPNTLVQYIMAAGAKRVEISEPVFTVVGETAVAQLSTQAVTYGGLEDD